MAILPNAAADASIGRPEPRPAFGLRRRALSFYKRALRIFCGVGGFLLNLFTGRAPEYSTCICFVRSGSGGRLLQWFGYVSQRGRSKYFIWINQKKKIESEYIPAVLGFPLATAATTVPFSRVKPIEARSGSSLPNMALTQPVNALAEKDERRGASANDRRQEIRGEVSGFYCDMRARPG